MATKTYTPEQIDTMVYLYAAGETMEALASRLGERYNSKSFQKLMHTVSIAYENWLRWKPA